MIELDRGGPGPGPGRPQGARARLSLVVHEAEPFEPGERRARGRAGEGRKARRPEPILLRVDAADFGAGADRGAEVGLRRLPRRERGPARDGDARGRPPAALRPRLPRRPLAGAAGASSTTCSAQPPLAACRDRDLDSLVRALDRPAMRGSGGPGRASVAAAAPSATS